MIYDCFIFNSEIDLLLLRLEYLFPYIDKFVIVESGQTFSGLKKELFFESNIEKFNQYLGKIIYLKCPNIAELVNPWDYESYQRNYIQQGLIKCSSNDLIMISDVDEFINIEFLLENKEKINVPSLIEFDLFYYFFNLRAQHKWKHFLITPYLFIKDFNIGDRNTYHNLNPIHYNSNSIAQGWHFSYLFGYDLESYSQKLKSFSHQEFNKNYYLDKKRIKICIDLGIDLFERKEYTYTVHDPKKLLHKELNHKIKQLGLNKYWHKRTKVYSWQHIIYFMKFKSIPKLKSFFLRKTFFIQ